MSLEAKIKALLEGKQENLLSEEELVESIVEIDEDGNPITEAKKDDEEDDDDSDAEAKKDDDKGTDEDDDDPDTGSSSANAKIKAGLSKKLEAGGEIKAISTDEPNNKRNNVDKNMVKEHIDALTENEELSEDFKTKAAVILEAAIADGVAKEVERLEEELAVQLDEAVDTVKAQLVEDIDGFLNVIVEKWMEENELALERGIKVDIVENFIDGMKNLFKENYIEVPDEKLDVLDEQAEQIEALLAANAELSESVAKLTEDVQASKKALAIEEVGSDLTDTDFEKFAGLLENVDYSEDFETKAKTILESYFPKTKVKHTKAIEEGTKEEVEVPAEMNKYVEALSGQLKF